MALTNEIFQSHALAAIVVLSIAHNEPDQTRDQISIWIKDMNLIYVKDYLISIQTNLEKHTSYSIALLTIYIATCLLYMYGSYTLKTSVMVPYIVCELVRLVVCAALLVTWLLVLKQNTMDIGLLIAASVVVGFGLLGQSYLWICNANLPIVINETEREEKLATIRKLEKMLESVRPGYPNLSMDDEYNERYRSNLFVVPRTKYNPGITGVDIRYTSSFLH
ncbi:uncharacterized protein LOC121731873 [Aricia agestis]|uniref:uncharacterized protein LOC121731873 n=1 Tax=Aricia agestis TaxID=91739 RepID=UPI001C208F83|nr:uncharacterized protein LOC121731873 [Aricia agestis]